MRRLLAPTCTFLLLMTPPAVAQDNVTFVDPSASSPAGAQYEIPVETARRDASPTPRRGGKMPSAATITADGGYGTPQVVPGTSGLDDLPSLTTASAESGSGGSGGSGSGSGRPGSGSGGGDGAEAAAVDPEATSTFGPDVGRSVLLLGLAIVAGAFLGGYARRAAR